MILTQRDLLLISRLQKFAVMTTKQITQTIFTGTSIKTVLRRLGKLRAAKYIQYTEGLQGYQRAWWLTEKGASLISDQPARKNISRFTLEHDVRLTDLRIKLEEIGLAKHWVPEHEIRSKMARHHGVESIKRKVVPDALIGVEVRACKESFALELELHSKSSKRYKEIFEDYQGKENLYAVWYITPTNELAENIESHWNKFNRGYSEVEFFWSTLDEILSQGSDALIHQGSAKGKISTAFRLKSKSLPADTPAVSVGR